MAVQNDFEKKRSKTLRWGYFFAGFAFILFLVFLGRILVLQNTNVQEIKDDYISKNYREATLKAARGNLYASDGSILATTVMRYDVYVDFKTIKDTIYNANIGALTDSLSTMFGKSWFGIILLIIVFIIGHAINIGLNALGSYVHTMRLQYVEMFGKFYEGGGKQFKPFKLNSKYIKIQEDKSK